MFYTQYRYTPNFFVAEYYGQCYGSDRFYADPDPAFLLNADPDPDPDPTCRI
jgi:hypothetical protein